MNNFLNLILILWQLPQNIIGLIMAMFIGFDKCSEVINKLGMPVIESRKRSSGSVSLGNFIFLSKSAAVNTFKHELGHTVQSMILGPLYLLVIGIPSFMWALLRRCGMFLKHSYYDFYTEKWADNIAGIVR